MEMLGGIIMLEVAQLHVEELDRLQKGIWFDKKYMYWNNSTYYEQMQIGENTWDSHSFASINKTGEVIGYISYSISRPDNVVTGLSIMNFTDDMITFGKDLRTVIDDIFVKFNFDKIDFTVVRGNPIEKSYDMLIKRYGGRIVGYREKEVRLIDGKMYDLKMYEIFRKEYMIHRHCRR